VQRDVRAHYSDVTVSLLGLWEHRGNVELYFKHRYQPFNYRIGKLTEYFAFPNVKLILTDLYEMEPKVLSEIEVDVLNCEQSDSARCQSVNLGERTSESKPVP